MGIDCESYVILVRTNGHQAERKLVVRDDAVGLSDARKIAKKLAMKNPQLLTEIFHRTADGGMILEPLDFSS